MECIIARLEKATVIRALQENQSLSDYFIHYLLTQNLRLKEHLIDHLLNSSEKRLARALLLLANFGKEGQEKRVLPKIDQETLGNLIGTTRGRVNHFMNKFRRLGFIEYDGCDICVHSALLNVVLHDPPQGVSALRTNESRAASREDGAGAAIPAAETQCLLRVVFDRLNQFFLPAHVRFAPKADLRLVAASGICRFTRASTASS